MPAEGPGGGAEGAAGDLEALLQQNEATRVRGSPSNSPPALGPRLPPGSGPADHLTRPARPHASHLQALDEAARPRSAAAAAPRAPPQERLEHARASYGALQRAALRAVADLAALQARVAQLLGQLGALAAQQTAAEHGFSDPVQLLDK